MSQRQHVRISRQGSSTASALPASVSRAAEAECSSCQGGHDIRRVALSAVVAGRSYQVQRAMNVSQPGDPSEVEADRVADGVMRMHSAPDVAARSSDAVARAGEEEEEVATKQFESATVQAKLSRQAEVARAEEDEEVATKRVDFAVSRETISREGEEDEEVKTKRMSRSPAPGVENGGDVSHIVQQGLSGGGQPLDSASRAFFEPRLGQDLSGIRIHTGAQASASTEQVSARAYAVGGDIAFRDGEYNPGTSAGRHLMAHELAHTVQQGATKPLATRQTARNKS